MTPTIPTPGQPLSEADVSLLKGDLLLCPIWGVVEFDRFDDSKRRAFVLDLKNNQFRLMVPANMTFLGRPDQDGWIAWSGGENPVPGVRVDVRFRDGEIRLNDQHSDKRWRHDPTIFLRFHIAAYRPHAPVSRPGDGVERNAVRLALEDADALERTADEADDNQWPDWSATMRQAAIRIRALAALRALTPPAEPVSRPAGEGEREAVARIIDPEAFAILQPNLLGIQVQRANERKAAAIAKADAILSLPRPAAPDAGGIATQAKIDIARDALTTARQALHQHFVDWDGEPEDALLLQEARSECDLALAALAHPPAQGSESGPDSLSDVGKFFLALDHLTRTTWRWGESCGIDNVSWDEKGDSYNEGCRADHLKAKRAVVEAFHAAVAEKAALSQPGPASEGDP